MTIQAKETAACRSLLERSAQIAPGRIESYGPDPEQLIEWFGEDVSGPTPLVLVHGGYFRPSIDRSHARFTAAELARELARPIALVEYRRVSGHPDETTADLCAVSDLLEGLYGGSAAWVGHSAGGTLVLQRAFDQVRPPVPTVALAPIVDLRRGLRDRLGDGAVGAWLGTRMAAKPGRYAHLDPSRLLTEVPERLPYVVSLHGQDDATVPVSQSGESRIPHRLLAGAHHFDLIDPETPAWAEVVQCFRHQVSAGASDL